MTVLSKKLLRSNFKLISLNFESANKESTSIRNNLVSPKVRAMAERRGSSLAYFKSRTEDKIATQVRDVMYALLV